jgi:polar amino acid transport system substrate-binding protein
MLRRIVLLLLMAVGASALAQQKVVIYTYDTLPPFAYRNAAGELTGVYVEIVRKAVSRMPDYAVSFEVVSWAGAKQLAEQGKAFAILPPYFHAHDWLTEAEPKRPYLWPYSLPLFTQSDVVICNEKALDARRKRYPDDFKGLSFVMWRGDGRAGVAFDRMVAEKRIDLQLVNEPKATIPALLSGKADCTVADQVAFAWYLRDLKASGAYEALDTKRVVLSEAAVVTTNEGHLGYTDINADQNFPFKKDFAIKFDIELHRMRKMGDLQSIADRFIKE